MSSNKKGESIIELTFLCWYHQKDNLLIINRTADNIKQLCGYGLLASLIEL